MKNANIRRYAELMVKGNREKTARDVVIKVLKVVYCLVAAGAIMACLTTMIGNLVWMSEYKDSTTSDGLALYNEHRTYFITMIIAVFTLVASFFLLKFKLCIPFALFSCVDCVIIFTTFYSVSNDNNFNTGASSSFWILAVPSILVALVAVILGSMLFVSYRLQIPKAYDKLVDELYRSNSKNGEVKLSPEEFEEILDNYKGEEIFPTDRPLKKSQRRRKQKQDLEMKEQEATAEDQE